MGLDEFQDLGLDFNGTDCIRVYQLGIVWEFDQDGININLNWIGWN